jgi:secondary thiamine-phosphate synthase enzyme
MNLIKSITVTTIARNEFKDITEEVHQFVRESNVSDGIILVYVPHTTAGITANENADIDVRGDMIKQLDFVIPWTNNYKHYEGNSAAHLKASLMGFSQTFIIQAGKLLLGTWQGIFFSEFDGPRKRTVLLKIIKG